MLPKQHYKTKDFTVYFFRDYSEYDTLLEMSYKCFLKKYCHLKGGIMLVTESESVSTVTFGESVACKLTEGIFLSYSPTLTKKDCKNPYYALVASLCLAKKLGVKHVFTPMLCTRQGMTHRDSDHFMFVAVWSYTPPEGTFLESEGFTFYKPSADTQRHLDIIQNGLN